MASKAIVFVGLLLALVVFLVSSQVSARDLAETSKNYETTETTSKDEVADAKYGGYPGGGYGGYPGGGYGGYPGGGYGGYPGGGYGGYPGRGGYGGYPGRGGYGGYPGRGGGGYGGYPGRGGYCRFGCCGRNYYGGGCRCCSYPGQNVDAQPQN